MSMYALWQVVEIEFELCQCRFVIADSNRNRIRNSNLAGAVAQLVER